MLAGGLQAQTVLWSGGADPSYDGNWGVATDWTNRALPPGPSDTARFAVNQAYSVSVVTNTSVKNFEITAGDVRLDILNNSDITATGALKVSDATLRIANGKVISNLDATSATNTIRGAATFTNAKVFLENGWLEAGPTVNTAPQAIETITTRPSTGELLYSGTLLVEGHGHFIGNLAPNLSSYTPSNFPLDVTIRAVGGDLVLGNNVTDDWRLFGKIETGANTVSIVVTNDLSSTSSGSTVHGRVTLGGGTLESNTSLGLLGGFEGFGTLRATGSLRPAWINIFGSSILTGDVLLNASAWSTIHEGKIDIGPNRLTVTDAAPVLPGQGRGFLINNAEIALAGGELVVNPVLHLRGYIVDTNPLVHPSISGFGVVRGKTTADYTDHRTGAGMAVVVVNPAEWFVPTGALTLAQTLAVGSDEVRLLSTAPTALNGGATIAGGTLYAPNGILLDGSNAVAGSGIVFGGAMGTNAANGWLGSGALTLTSALNAGAGPVMLLAGSPVGVAAAVTMGGGTLRAPSGLSLESGGLVAGSGVVEARVSGTGSITLDGNLTLGDAASIVGVAYTGNSTVGAHTLTLRDADFASLGGATTIAGGTITAANGLTLPLGSTLSGFGMVAGSMWNAGTITATGGNLTIGSTTGTYFSDQSGVLNVGAERVNLLGTSVTLGNSTTLAGGQLVAPSGFVYDTTRKVSGFGTIRTENSVGLEVAMATPTGALTVGTDVSVGTSTLTFLSNADTVLNAALTLAGGRLTASGFGLAIGSSGSVSGYGTINQPVTNAGTINVTSGQQLTINGLFANTGTVNPTGTLRLTAGGTLGGTFGAGSLALAGGTYALPSAWTIPTGLSVDLSGSTFAGPGALQIGTGATLRVAGGGGTVNTAVTNTGTLALAGSLVGTGTLTNQGLLRAEEILSGGNPAYPFLGVHAAVGVATTNAASGTVQVSAGRALEFLGPVTNAGALDVGGTMRFGGALTHTGTATVAGTLDIRGGGTSTGAFNLAGGSVVFNGLGGTFTVANSATGLTGAGGLNFASGTTVLNYGVTAAPVTINQSLSFTGGTLELPGATSLRTSSLVLERRYSEITGLVASVGSTPNLPTTVLAGGNFGWGAGTVRNTLTLEAGVTPPLVRSGDINLDGTLINRTTNLRFEAGFKAVTQSVASSDAGGSTRFFTASLAEGSFGGTGTLRNEGTLAVDLSGLRGRTYDYFGISTDEFSGLNWTPGIENLGTATLGGNSAVGPSFAALTSGGTFTGPITNSGNLTLFGRIGLSNLTQTAGTTTLLNGPTVAGGAWNVGTGSTLTAPNGAYLSVNLANSGTLDFGAGTTVGTLQNQAGGTVRVAGVLATQPAFLTGNAGTIILDGPAAGLRTIGTTVIDGKFLPGDPLALGSLAGGTLDIRNGANLSLTNDFSGPAFLKVGSGSTLTLSNGTLSGSGELSILSGGVVNHTGGSLARSTLIGGTYNWSGGGWSSGGTTTVASGGVLAISGAVAHDYLGRAIVNNGTVNWSDGPIRSGNGGSITNNGAWNDSTATAPYFGADFGGGASFTNALGAT